MQYATNKLPSAEESVDVRARWLTTFNDMITLMMVFFVLLFAMGSLDTNRFQNFQDSLQSAMGVLESGGQDPDGILSTNTDSPSKEMNSDRPMEEGNADLKQLENTVGLEAEITKKGIQLTLNDELLFKSGSAQLTPQGYSLLDQVASIIGPLNRLIRVEGHTDNVPITTDRYPSNWELSTARAVSVVKYMDENGKIPPRYLSAAGYGASKQRALNDTESGRSKNRRVEIILQQKAPSQLVQ